jgi:hypothetical protein
MRGSLHAERQQVVQQQHLTHLRFDWKMADDWHRVSIRLQWRHVHGQLRSRLTPVQQQ